MFGAIAGGIASALAGGAMSKLFGGGQKAASGGIQGDVLATDNNTVGMGDAGIKSAIQGSNVPNPDEAVPSFVSGAMAKAGKGLLEGTLQAGTSAVSDKLLDLVGLATKSNQIKQLIRNGRSASLQRTFKKSFTSFSHSTSNKTRDGQIGRASCRDRLQDQRCEGSLT